MNLAERIFNDMKTAMKNKDKQSLAAIRLIKGALQKKRIELRSSKKDTDKRPLESETEMTDEEVLGVLTKMVKQIKDTIDEYESVGRTDKAEQEKTELKTIETYLPEQMSIDEIKKIVDDAIHTTGAASMKDMGSVMGIVTGKTKGRADGKLIADLVKEKLNS